jgi:chemotaxis regulatin CheY-phosphate phosphatase CheZ
VTFPSVTPTFTPDIADAEFEAIESALVATARGRSFLNELARRNRQADTQTVLSAIERLEGSIRVQDPIADVQRFRGDVLEMARRIADTRQQIVALRSEEDEDTTIGRARGELDAIVQATESATGGILEAAEEIQEIAWTLREGGFAVETCEAIDQRATNIYLACSFQDLTSQRIRKVIEAMQFLESRISQMIDIWGFSQEELATPSSSAALVGPTLTGLMQDEVDQALGTSVTPATQTFSSFDVFGAGYDSAPILQSNEAAVDAAMDLAGLSHGDLEPHARAAAQQIEIQPETATLGIFEAHGDVVIALPSAKQDELVIAPHEAELMPVAVAAELSSKLEPEFPAQESGTMALSDLQQRLSPVDALPTREKLRDFE